MFRNSVKIFQIFGIDVELDISWFLVFFLFSFTLSRHYYPQELPGIQDTVYWVLGISTTIIVFISVLIHELAHSLMAINEGIPINKITLFIFGGVAQMKKEPELPQAELKISVVGPLSSIVLSAIFGILFLVFPRGIPFSEFVWFLARMNLLVGILNLIPAFPLDGGRILRAFLWMRKGNLLNATRIAVAAGSYFAFFAMGIGFVMLFISGSVWGLWYIFLGWLLYQSGQSSYSQVALKESLSGIKVRDVMSDRVQVVGTNLSIEKLIEEFYKHKFGAFPVMDDSTLKGLITMNRLKDIPKSQWTKTAVGEVMVPLEHCLVVGPDEEAVEAMMKMASEGAGRALVVQEDRLLGILSNTDMMRLIKIKTMFGSMKAGD